MSFSSFAVKEDAIELLQRSLARQRLGHAYLFSGDNLEHLELVARTLAKTLNCEQRGGNRATAVADSCDRCLSCRKIDHGTHPDIQWIRPESKSRVIVIDQIRNLMQAIFLKPTAAEY